MFSISTTRHDSVDTKRPGASSCACRNSTFAVEVHNTKNSPAPWYPRDLIEKYWPTADSATAVGCRTFVRKIYRLSIRIHRMDPQRCADATYDEPPPPYKYQRMQELPASSIHELPDQRILTPELEGDDGIAELGSSVEQTIDYPFNLDPSQTFYPCSSEANERGATANCTVLQQPTSVDVPRLPWSLDTQQHSASAPSLTIDGLSHESSPISPITTDTNGNSPTQSYSDTDLMAGMVSPLGTVSSCDSSWTRSHVVDKDYGCASYTSLPTSLEAIPIESFLETPQQSQAERLHVRRDDFLHPAVTPIFASHESYIPNSHPPVAWNDYLPKSHAQQDDSTTILLGDYAYCERLGWRYCGGYGGGAAQDEGAKQAVLTISEPGSSQHASHFDECQPSSHKFIELHDHQDPELYMESRADDTNYPLEHCTQCDKTFSGRYALLFTSRSYTSTDLTTDIGKATCDGMSSLSTTR